MRERIENFKELYLSLRKDGVDYHRAMEIALDKSKGGERV